MNIFVEGIPGSGKSTLLHNLQERFSDYHFYYEGDISPVDLAWCSYMTPQQFLKAKQDWPQLAVELENNSKMEENHVIVSYTKIRTDNHDFYQYMERYELYGGRQNLEEFKRIVMERFHNFHGTDHVFECAFFQNIIEELMLFHTYDDNQILDFYREMIENIQDDFFVIRLVSNDIKQSIQKIKEERVNEQGDEVWYHLMMDYLNQSPYGKTHHYEEFDDMLKHFERRIALESKISKQLLHNRYVDIESKNYQMEDIIHLLESKNQRE